MFSDARLKRDIESICHVADMQHSCVKLSIGGDRDLHDNVAAIGKEMCVTANRACRIT